MYFCVDTLNTLDSNLRSPSNNRQSGQDSLQSQSNIVERGHSWIYFGKLIDCRLGSPTYSIEGTEMEIVKLFTFSSDRLS